MSALTKPAAGIAGTPIDPGSPGGILIDPETEISGSPGLNEVIKGDGLGGWIIGPAPHGPTTVAQPVALAILDHSETRFFRKNQVS